MATLFATTLIAAEGEHVARPLPMPAELFGIIGVVIVFLLLFVMWFFRHSAPPKAEGISVGRGPAHEARPIDAAKHGGHH